MVKNQKYYEGLDKNSDEYKAYAKFNRISNNMKPISQKGCLKIGRFSPVAIIILSIIAVVLTIIFI